MKIILNGEKKEVGEAGNLSELLSDLEVKAGAVVVEHNKVVVPQKEYGDCGLHEGDCVEIVHFVGGGAPGKTFGFELKRRTF